MPKLGRFGKKALKSVLCPVCGNLLLSLTQEEDAWGNRYCSNHASEYPRCSCCQRLICERLTGGGVGYSDGRKACNICRSTAIDTVEQALPRVIEVVNWVKALGFTFPHLDIKISLALRSDLNAHSEHHGGEIQGMFFKSYITGGGRAVQRRVDGISVLKGLSRHVMAGVVVHELGHAWLFLHGVDGLDSPTEEGFCNELSHIFHTSFKTDEARFCMRVIELNPDKVYGDGFRAVHAAVQRYGLATIVDYLRLHRMLPPS